MEEVKSAASMHFPFQRDGTGPIPLSVKLSDSGQIPAFFLCHITRSFSFVRNYWRKTKTWKLGINFMLKGLVMVGLDPLGLGETWFWFIHLCLGYRWWYRNLGILKSLSRSWDWSPLSELFDTWENPMNESCGVSIVDQGKRIQPLDFLRLNWPPLLIVELRSLRNHSYTYVLLHLVSCHKFNFHAMHVIRQ